MAGLAGLTGVKGLAGLKGLEQHPLPSSQSPSHSLVEFGSNSQIKIKIWWKKRLCISEPWCFGAMWVNGLQGGRPRILSFLFISSVGLSLSQTQTFHINSIEEGAKKVIVF